jgi:hypothetical protein
MLRCEHSNTRNFAIEEFASCHAVSIATPEILLNNSSKAPPDNPHRITSREHINYLF